MNWRTTNNRTTETRPWLMVAQFRRLVPVHLAFRPYPARSVLTWSWSTLDAVREPNQTIQLLPNAEFMGFISADCPFMPSASTARNLDSTVQWVLPAAPWFHRPPWTMLGTIHTWSLVPGVTRDGHQPSIAAVWHDTASATKSTPPPQRARGPP